MPFETTQWSMVYAAGGNESTESRRALETLCATYWSPLFHFALRRGLSEEDAREMTQEFFAQLLERHALDNLDQTRGKFRSFLLAAFTNMLNNEWDRQNAKKRRPTLPLLSLTGTEGGERFEVPELESMSPELVYDREWALTILRESMNALECYYRDLGKPDVFQCLKPYLTVGADKHAYAELAQRLALSPAGAKVAVHRIRKRYHDEIRRHIANTVESIADIDEELRYLLDVLAHDNSTSE